MRELIFMVEEKAGGGYQADPIRDSYYTEAKSMEDLKELMEDVETCVYDE